MKRPERIGPTMSGIVAQEIACKTGCAFLGVILKNDIGQ